MAHYIGLLVGSVVCGFLSDTYVLQVYVYFKNVWGPHESIKSRQSKKDKQHNGQKKKDKRTNNDLQNTTQKTKDRPTQTPLKLEVNLCALEV